MEEFVSWQLFQSGHIITFNFRSYNHSLHNDFTYISTRGTSVVDYCIVPYEKLTVFDNFEVIRAQHLTDSIFNVGEYEPKHIPDHSLLCWTFSTQVCVNENVAPYDQLHMKQSKNIKFDIRNIPNEWMKDVEIVTKLKLLIKTVNRQKGNIGTVVKMNFWTFEYPK